MTHDATGAGNQGKGAAPAAPARTLSDVRRSTRAVAIEALDEFAKAERLWGAAKAHADFDGILAEHALALEEARDMLREVQPATDYPAVVLAIDMLNEQITYIRALGSVAVSEEDEDAK